MATFIAELIEASIQQTMFESHRNFQNPNGPAEQDVRLPSPPSEEWQRLTLRLVADGISVCKEGGGRPPDWNDFCKQAVGTLSPLVNNLM